MTETRIQATDRLRQEGRWQTAWQYKEEQRLTLPATGWHRREATEKPWQRMLQQFPPPPKSGSA